MIHRRIRPCLAVLAVLAALAASASRAQEALTGIHVTGTGEVQVVPDMARVTLEVRREGSDAAALKAELDEVTTQVLALARDLDIPERHVTAAAVSIYPRYRRDEQTPEGVIASRTIEVTLEDLESLVPLINGALERGANGVQGVALDASNRPELESKALDAAIDDAVQEAGRIAKRFDVGLGPLKDARASTHSVQPMVMEAAMMRSAAKDSSTAPGELTIRRDVQATFGIRP